MSLIEKYNIDEKDIYTICSYESLKSNSSFFEKEKLKGKIMGVLKPYKVKFLDLGTLIEEITSKNYDKDQSLIDKYGAVEVEKGNFSFGISMKTFLGIFIGSFLIFFLLFGGLDGVSSKDCSSSIKAYEFGREMAFYSSLRGGIGLSNSIDEYYGSLGISGYSSDNACVKQGFQDAKNDKDSRY